MGIRLLNRFIKDTCNESSNVYSFQALENKKIVIDIYNYIYRFLANNRLLEELDIFCKILHKHNIRALFVFDGKYGDEKKKEQEKRREQRKNAIELYDKLNEQYENKIKTKKVKRKLNMLKREKVKLSKWDIVDVKKYLDVAGMKYVVADGEAEELCCELVNKNKVFACMSEDTDLFALGCKRIIKAIHFKREEFYMYSLNNILNNLNMDINVFRMICTLSCNDYSNDNSNKHFIYFMNLYNKFLETNNDQYKDFVNWLEQKKYIFENEKQNYFTNQNIFDISNKNLISHLKFISLHNGIYNKRKINAIMIDRKMYLNGDM